MENQNLRKRLYQNLSHRPLKHTFLLETEMKDPKSTSGILKPKILQESVGDLKNLSNSFVVSPTLLKSPEFTDKKSKPQKVDVQKLSKQAKTMLEDEKNKIKSNLKPVQIFAFYDAFPEMIQDFFYLNRMSHPYDYQIVSYAKRNSKEYMTISSQGVTLYHDKEAEFLTRDQWLEDEKIYYQLQKIDFFSQYKLSKNFMIWKNKMKRHYMRSMSNILREKLFLTSVHPRECLVKVRQLCMELEQDLNLLPVEHLQIPSWQELIENTNNHLSNTLTLRISEQENQIVQSLSDAINKQIDNFKINNKIKIDGLNNDEENKEGYIYSQEAILRKQYKRVLKLIKLAEGLLLESKIKLIKRWLEEILEKLEGLKDSNFRDEWLTINFVAMPPQEGSNDIIWDPSSQSFIHIFKGIIDKAIEEICKKHDKIMNHPVFQRYRNSDDQSFNKDDRHNFLKNLIQESDFYNDLTRKIRKNLQREFEQVNEQGKELRKYVQIYNKHKNMPPLEQIIKQSTAAEIAIYVHEWKQDNEQMKDLADKCMGMIKFDFSLMRKEMMSVAENSYTRLFAMLPNHLSELCRETTDRTEELLRPIDLKYNDETFVQSTKALKKASDNVEAICEQGFEIKRLELLMIQNKCPSIDVHKAKLSELAKKIEQLTKVVGQAERLQGQNLTEFKKKNEVIVQAIKKSIKQYLEMVQKLQLEQKHLSQETITQKISQIELKVAGLDKQATSINNVQNQLGLPETDFTQAHNLYKRTKMLSSLWNQKKLWSLFISQLSKKHYCDINYEKEMKTWQDFSTQIASIKQVLDQNQHLNQLSKQINDFNSEMQLVKALQSKSLNERSWKQISQYLAYEFDKKQYQSDQKPVVQPFKNPKDSIYTMQWIKINRLYHYKERIELIVKNSEKETYLSNVINTLRTYISNLNLKFITKKSDLNLLADNSIVLEELSDHLAALLQIFNEDYSELLKKDAKILAKQYEYVIEILEAYRDFSLNWQKYEQLFDISKNHSKMLIKQSKDFAILETMWKKMSKGIMSYDWIKKVSDEAVGTNPNRNTMKLIQKANSCWQQIKKGVEQYLDRKRNTFHHYFYCSDDELLVLLKKFGQSSNINSVVPFIYENIKSVNFDPNSDALASIVSADGEELKIIKGPNCKTVSDFEQLLKSCEDVWKKSLIQTIKKIFSDFVSVNEEQLTRQRIVLENVTQVALAFDQIVWVKLAEWTYLCAEPVGLLTDWIAIQNTQIKQLKELRNRKGLTELQRRKLDLVTVQLIYLRDKTEHFHQTMTKSLDSYEWDRTLKLCDGTGNTLYLKTLDSVNFYGGQFLGLANSVFIAPETQKSYLNLAQLIFDRQIGVISTASHNIETIKSFGYLIAQNFRQFNLFQGVTERTIDRILSGICSQGIWSCLSLPNNWEIISYLATHISLIEKCIRVKENLRENTFSAQINKHSITINQYTLPVFFIQATVRQLQNLRKIPKLNFRPIELIKPSIKCVLAFNLSQIEGSEEVVEVVAEITNYCRQLFIDQHYDEFGIEFALKVLNQVKVKSSQPGENLRRKAAKSVMKILIHKLKQEDQVLLQAFVQAYNFESDQKLKMKKSPTLDIPMHSYKIIAQESTKHGERFLRITNNLYQTINQSWETNKNIVVVGSQFSGKTSAINFVKKFMEKQSKGKRKINLETIHFMAYKDYDLVSPSDKGPGIVARCIKQNYQNWLLLDGPLNSKYLNLFTNITSHAALSNFGVVSNSPTSRRMKVILETTNLSAISPDFLHYNQIFYVEEDEKTPQAIIRANLINFRYKDHEESVRMEVKGDENAQFEVKSFKIKQKPIGLPKQLIDCLIAQLVSLIDKIAFKGTVKIKSLQLLYQISTLELAFRCSKLIDCVFTANWDSINDKVTKKSVQKFAIWVLLWSVSTVVSPDDYQKLEKSVSEIAKSSLCDDMLKSIVFPGSGLQIFHINSERAQNTLFSNYGGICNVVDRYEALFNTDSNTVKNKFQPNFYDAEPSKLRVITEQSVIFSYFDMINRQARLPIALYGPQASGKKSIIDVFNKSNEESVECHSIRFKKYNPYFISKQLVRPFNKFNCLGKVILKPYNISKRVHISIDDVAMTPYQEPSMEFLRMVADTGSFFDEKFNQAEFRQLMLTISVNQVQFHNSQGVDFRRLLSRFFILQTASKNKQSLSSIYSVILLNLLNGKFEDSECFLNKSGQNIIINSTLCIYSFVQDMIAQLSCQSISQTNKKLLLVPKIQEVCNVITNICKIEEEGEIDMEYYAEVWAHQILRVFGDKLANQQDEQALFDEVKKYSFMEFKHNISNALTGYIFTNFATKSNGGFVYNKYKSISELKKQIEESYCRESNSDELPFIQDSILFSIMSIYRVLQMKGGHLLLAAPYKKSGKQLIKIANYLLKSQLYHDLEHGEIDFDVNLAPSILKDMGATLVMDVQEVTEEGLYQLTCLANRNLCEFDISSEVKDKIKSRLFALAQEGLNKQSENNQVNISISVAKSKPAVAGEGQDTIKHQQLQNQIQINLLQICIDCLSDYIHIATCVHPSKLETTKFLNENMSLVKFMQVCWHEYKNETLTCVSERLLAIYPKESVQVDLAFMAKSMKIYDSLTEEFKGYCNFMRYHENCCRTYQNLVLKVNEQVEQSKECLEVISNNLTIIEEQKNTSKRIQQNLQQLMKYKEELASRMKQAEQSGATQELEKLQEKMKRLRIDKQNIDIQSREQRVYETMCETFANLLPQKEQLEKKLAVFAGILEKSQEYSIMVESALLYLNNASKKEYMEWFNRWLALLNHSQVQTVEGIVQLFSKVYQIEFMKIPGWHNFSTFTQLKGFHFCQNFRQIPDSIFGAEPIVVNDQEQILAKLLAKISSPSYPNAKLISYTCSQKDSKKQARISRAQIMANVERQIIKAINEQKQEPRPDDKHELKRGIILLGENGKWTPNRNDIDMLEKKMQRERRILVNSHVVIRGKTSPNITFHPDNEDLRFILLQKSMQIEYGEGLVNQNNKIETLVRQHLIIEEQKIQTLIERSIEKENQEIVLQKIQMTQKQMGLIKNDKNKMSQLLLEERRRASDIFLIDWLLSFQNDSAAWNFQRVVEVYQFLKRCLMDLNTGREQKLKQISEIDPSIVQNWQSLIKTNLSDPSQASLEQIIKFTMPLEYISTLILIPQHINTEASLQQTLASCNHSSHTIDLLASSHGQTKQSPAIEQQGKSVWVFNNFVSANGHHLAFFLDHCEKNKGTMGPVVLIICDDVEQMGANQQLGHIFRVLTKDLQQITGDLHQQILSIENEEQRQRRTMFEPSKTNKKGLQEDQEGQLLSGGPKNNQEQLPKFKHLAIKFLTILVGAMGTRNGKLIQHIPFKAISSRISIPRNFEQLKVFFNDMINLPKEWSELLSDLLLTTDADKIRQIEALYLEYKQLLQKKEAYQQKVESPPVKGSQLHFIKSEDVEVMLGQIPFAFNCQDFKQTNEHLSLWLISQANRLNQKRFFLKKFLQDCLKICKGNKLSYWTHKNKFGFQLPTKNDIDKLCGDIKIIKRGLQMVGLINGVDISSKEIKCNSISAGQLQSILSIACQALDCKSYDGFSEKLIVLMMIKASRKLKLPLSRLKKTWRIINKDSVEQQVNGQNCLAITTTPLNAEQFLEHKALLLTESTPGATKLLLMLYDPTLTVVAVQPVSKQPKKQKLKKTKQELNKSLYCQNVHNTLQVPVKMSHGVEIGCVKVTFDQETPKYRHVVREPCFKI